MTTGGQAFLTMYHGIISYSFNINPLSRNALQCALATYFFYLSNARRFYLSMGKLCNLIG
jgi:hypothetical protein